MLQSTPYVTTNRKPKNEKKHQIMKRSQDTFHAARLTTESHTCVNIMHVVQEVTVLVYPMFREFRQKVLVLRPFVRLERAICERGVSLMTLIGENRNYRRKNCPSATLYTVNLVSKRTYEE